MRKSSYEKKYIIIVIIAIIAIIVIALFINRASSKRWLKSLSSEMNNGINRTITVYDYNGNEIRHWTGKFDVTEGESGMLFDDENGKRVIINGGIIINEENQ